MTAPSSRKRIIERAALDDVGVTERLLLDARVVEVRAVRAAEILDDVAAALHFGICGVPARDHAVVGADRAFESAADVARSRSATARPSPPGPGCPGKCRRAIELRNRTGTPTRMPEGLS